MKVLKLMIISIFRAQKNFKEAISIDRKFYEAYVMLGELMEKQKRYSEAAANYKTAVRIDSLFFKPFFLILQIRNVSGDYCNALLHFNVYLAQEGMSEKNRVYALNNIKNCEFAIEAMKEPIPFNPISAGSGINTQDDEYWPSITADGQTLMFTRQGTSQGNRTHSAKSQEDFYISYYSDDEWK